MNFLFCDLDDTLFQSGRKTPSEPDVSVAAHSPDGVPNAFMTAIQRTAFETMLGAMTVIPVTARDHDALSRVKLPAVSFAIIDHGGVILDGARRPLESWHEISAKYAIRARPWLEDLRGGASNFIHKEGLSTSSRIISDFDLPFYWVSKYRDDQHQDLDRIEREFIRPWMRRSPELAWTHRNGNNLAVLPRSLQKSNAVRFLLRELRKQKPSLVSWGMGDSTSDIPFLLECDYMIAPSRSQIAMHLSGLGA